MNNLNFPNPVSSEKDFFGTKPRANLEHIVRILASGHTPVVVKGERRIGKTSLQNVVLQQLKASPVQNITPLHVEPRGVTSLDDLAQAVLQRLATHLKKNLQDTGLVKDGSRIHLETPDAFEGAFASLLPPGSNDSYLLCIDEFDEIIRKAGNEQARLMGLLSWLSEKTDLPVTLFFTMTFLPEPLRDSFPTPFSNVAQIVEIQPFELQDTVEMIQALVAGDLVLFEGAADWFYKMSGGHPYFSKLLLANLLCQKQHEPEPMEVSQSDLDRALDEAIRDPRAQVAMENLYPIHFNKREKSVLLLLADMQRPITVSELDGADVSFLTAAKNLTQRGYLKRTEDHFDLRIGFIGHWLRNWNEYDVEIDSLQVKRILDPWGGGQPTVVKDDDLWRYQLS